MNRRVLHHWILGKRHLDIHVWLWLYWHVEPQFRFQVGDEGTKEVLEALHLNLVPILGCRLLSVVAERVKEHLESVFEHGTQLVVFSDGVPIEDDAAVAALNLVGVHYKTWGRKERIYLLINYKLIVWGFGVLGFWGY